MTSAPEWATARTQDDEALEVLRLDERRGLGVRALRGFAAGETMHRFAGVVGEAICQHSLQIDALRHISGTRYIGYLSHGCEPNARLDMAGFTLVALRAIAAGEVVTIDYAETEDRLHRQFACGCGAAACRGWIHGRSEGPNAEGQAWLENHAAG
ncbi:SET domain-containing protein-lysine N-methyltransferase [Rhizorhabdus dicambivorans]|uniref:SET domain-containing protein-lysine N-methyltransferase n=1 Tax=Rhizorhabdus dicambivorans TaxID=1850238 RepID=A0A2A4FUG5_9SPHN|nr:SET domain-containing protein-lysine N-methyltransferase [Rhizorhabdus dicambivorans]ATE66467.1 SET domain-containing protein-lysine N-methyltransferase [Rhizorhabdus dicambivorans]PCE41041.1 SET domain-containing protein-lysine N-methyltransferase [Rhizorhabdus dicambivorans]